MTKKVDMSSRYAAARERSEQRRRQTPAREYLPLADDYSASTMATTADGAATTLARGRSVLTSRLPAIDYGYLRSDLMRIAALAISLFIVMIVLSFFVHP